jgi:hypothetical protein
MSLLNPRPVWTLQEAQLLVNELWEPCNVLGYYIGLTGSVLLNGWSANDLDLILYPSGDLYMDYRDCCQRVRGHLSYGQAEALDARPLKVVQRSDKTGQYKLIVTCHDAHGRRVEMFIPNFTFLGRLDTWECVEGKDAEKYNVAGVVGEDTP